MEGMFATTILGLAVLGFVALSSAVWRHPGGPMHLARQAGWLTCGGLVGFGFYRVRFEAWMKRAPLLYAAAMAILVAAVAVSRNFPDFHPSADFSYMQVGGLVALPVMLMAGRVLQREMEPSLSAKGLGVVLAVSGLPVGLLLLMPGDTNALAYVVMTFMPLGQLGIRRLTWAVLFWVIITVGLFVALHQGLGRHGGHPPIFFDPQPDSTRSGYTLKCMAAVSAGGLSGKGFAKGNFSQCYGIDDLSTELVFASFGEEFGFVGVTLALGLFALLGVSCLRAARWAGARPQCFVAAAVAWFVGWHVMMHTATVSLVVPANGFSLPLFSSGPATVAFVAMLAIVLGIMKDYGRR
jgi:cell division protein FtsW (lipid II flippase)